MPIPDISETFDSHDGTEIRDNATNAKRRFLVKTPVGQDPIDIIQGIPADPDDEPTETGLSIGTPHPSDNVPTVVKGIRILSRLNEDRFLLEVQYGLEDTVQGIVFNGWNVSYSSVTEQRDLIQSIENVGTDAKVIGIPAYTMIEPEGADATTLYIDRGKPPVPAKAADPPCHEAREAIAATSKTDVWKVPGDCVVKRTPYPSTINRVQAVLVKKFSIFDFSEASPGRLQAISNTVNWSNFMGAPRGSARFVDWRIVQTEGVDDFNKPEIQFEVTLVFEFDFTRTIDPDNRCFRKITGFNPFQVIHVMTVTEDDGTTCDYVVKDSETPNSQACTDSGRAEDESVFSNFNVTFWVDYNDTLADFDALEGPRRSLRRGFP